MDKWAFNCSYQCWERWTSSKYG